MINIYMILIFLVVGCFTGIISAMFGFGGGIVMVPVLFWVMTLLDVPSHIIMHFAVGTSLAVMMISNLNTVRVHMVARNILWRVVVKMFPWVAVGAIVGALSSHFIHSDWLRYLFVIFIGFIMVTAWLQRKHFLSSQSLDNFTLPSMSATVPLSFFAGLISVWLGIGGSIFTVLFFRKAKMPMLNAAATASGLTPAVAISGVVGYIITGLHAHNLPSQMLGFIYIPGFLGLAIGTLLGVPIGRRVVMILSKLSDAILSKMYFAILLLIFISMLV